MKIEEGNIVQVEMQCIDANSYIYYFTLAQVQGNGPGGGTTPGNAPNGITGGALGLIFGFYNTNKVNTYSLAKGCFYYLINSFSWLRFSKQIKLKAKEMPAGCKQI